MNLKNDFLQLINAMWDIEQFDMWVPREHGSAAYLLDRLYYTEEYQSRYDELYSLVKNKQANEFAMKATTYIVELAQKDERYSKEDLLDLDILYKQQKEDYDNEEMFGIGIVNQKFMPDWFFELFHGYIGLEKLKIENSVIEYCQLKENKSIKEADELFEQLASAPDILNEFYFFTKNDRFTTFYPLTENQLSAEELCNTIGLTPLEAYLYLVYLRNEPTKARAEYEERLSNLKNKNKDTITSEDEKK